MGDLLDRLGAEGCGFLYSGDVAHAVSDWVLERGGMLSRDDLGSYEVIEREPARVTYRGREVLTNPPPSSGGILIADALGILERLERPHDPYVIAEVIASTNRARDEEFLEGLATEGFLERFLAKQALDSVATEVRSRLGNTTHVSVMDAEGACASVTCSNGSCSGVVVPGTGVHLNNMLGEQDLNPLGFHRHAPGVARAEHDGADGGAERRAARDRDRQRRVEPDPLGDPPDRAGRGGPRAARAGGGSAPRLHVEEGQVDAEPGVDDAALDRLEQAGWTVQALERAEPVLRRRPGRRAQPGDAAASPEAATRAGAGSQPWSARPAKVCGFPQFRAGSRGRSVAHVPESRSPECTPPSTGSPPSSAAARAAPRSSPRRAAWWPPRRSQ